MYRKRSGLSQEETALLLGYPNGQPISRYERFGRQPPIKTVLAYEAVFGVPVRELLGGVYDQQVAAIQERARLLKHNLEHPKPDTEPAKLKRQTPHRRMARKLELLSAITSSSQTKSIIHS
jgi:transcriptional regulator with XRE-family HTH domain